LLPGNSTIEAGAQALLENGAVPEDFSNALMGQLALLSGANGQAELPVQLQSTTTPQPIDNLNDIGDLLKQKGGEEEFVALFDKYLSIFDKKNAAVDLNKDVDLEATLLALTDALKSTTPNSTPDEMASAQNMLVLTDELKSITPNSAPDEMAAAQNMLALTDALKSITPGITTDEVTATAQDTGAVIALNGLPFVKPLPDEAKLNMPGGENLVSGDFLQKETVLRQSIQNEQGSNFQFMENAGSAEKTLVIEKQASISGTEKAAPGVIADMIPFHRPVDNKTDSPAITRPLTHPGWSKDLGEQIVWMNNKAIPAAEIRLNPAHLGPISVRIDVNQDQATIMFTAQHAEVKEAIEASIPKLREMLGTQQLNLINVNISQNSTSDQGRSQSQTFSKTPENREQGIEGVTDTKIEHDRVVVSKGLLSLYA
jgi:flagellar hook-length control protein FliK